MEAIEKFIKLGSGSGSGDGDGYGYCYGDGSGSGDGDGSGYGDGDGSGSGDGSGYGDGYGDGYGYGDGFKSINNITIYKIDRINTGIHKVKNNIAKGFILNYDMTMTDCFIVKNNTYFAHGSTIKEALKALNDKVFANLNVEEKIKEFKNKFTEYSKKYSAKLFFEWHYLLTGSCELGRMSFAKQKGIDIEKDKLSVLEFIELTKNEYSGEIIKQLINKQS